jgi:hypothetical protein
MFYTISSKFTFLQANTKGKSNRTQHQSNEMDGCLTE